MNARKWIGCVLAALLLPLIIGGLRARAFLAREQAPLVAASLLDTPSAGLHDPRKPTVAVVLGADVTEITDMVAPYEMLARTGRYNVYAVAQSAISTTLTGGLRVRPHYSFEELNQLLAGSPPAIVVAPNVPNIRSAENRPLVQWVRRSADAGATLLSWCAGAAVLAEAGLLAGRTATSHWGDIQRLEREYPNVRWRRGVRWIDHGNIITSAGITSGVDATLRLLIRLGGEDVARRVAAELRYPNFHFAIQPLAEQYTPRVSDAVLFLNAAFRLRQRIGVGLYDGVGEIDVSTVFDAHAAAAVAQVHAVATKSGLVRTRHGLWIEPALVSDRDGAEIASLDRVIIPGRDVNAEVQQRIRELGGPAVEYPHAEGVQRFSLEPVLEDLARTTDVATATFAQRRLEYRSPGLRLEGNALPIPVLLSALLLAIAGAIGFVRLVRPSPHPIESVTCCAPSTRSTATAPR